MKCAHNLTFARGRKRDPGCSKWAQVVPMDVWLRVPERKSEENWPEGGEEGPTGGWYETRV